MLKTFMRAGLLAMSLLCLAHAPVQAVPAEPAAAAAAASTAQFRVAPVDDAWRNALPRDAAAATQAYLDRLPAEVVQRSNAYFEGKYWLRLWNFLLGLGIAALLLQGRRSARLRDWAQRVGRKAFFRDALYGMAYALASWLLSLPLGIYEDFVREHQYGMATQGFGAWFGEQLIGLAVSLVVTGLVVGVLYAVVRKAGERWWLWGTVTGMAVMVLGLVVAPIWIDPLFNTYKPVADGPIKASVLTMAKANGVPADNVYEFDASRQTTRVSANVSGIFGSAAVRLNDNLLRRTSVPEIRAVMGHELGHYVLNHVAKMMCQFALLLLVGFLFANWLMGRLLARQGQAWAVQGVADVASLPLLTAVFSVFFFLGTPVLNSIIRSQEAEADQFSLNLAREPHGFSEAMLKLVEYRKPDPTALEEFVFYDHPSARSRIYAAMRWREAMGTP